MSLFNLKPAESSRFDEISMGEVMLRLDPGEGRIRTARSFRAWEGGGNITSHADSAVALAFAPRF